MATSELEALGTPRTPPQANLVQHKNLVTPNGTTETHENLSDFNNNSNNINNNSGASCLGSQHNESASDISISSASTCNKRIQTSPQTEARDETGKSACYRCRTSVATASVGCQTDANLIDKLIDNHQRKQLDNVDLYQEYVRSAECAQFWPLDKNPVRSLVPAMLKVDLPEQHLKNESLMFDLVQAITNHSKLVNLLAKYIHHIVPNVIISKRIDLIPLITCTIRVCHDASEQERLISLLFNLIKRPNEEQRRMILSGIIVVLQVSPHQNSSLLLPNLWDHVNDKFPERRILLVESCCTLAHYVRPIMRTNLILSILIQLLKDKNAAVRSAACKSFACLLSLIMDRNDEVFDACLSATEDIIQDMLQQTPVSLCEHRYELEQMRFAILETIFPLVSMWAVKLNRFKLEVAEFYLAKAERYFFNLLNNNGLGNTTHNSPALVSSPLECPQISQQLQQTAINVAAVAGQQQNQQQPTQANPPIQTPFDASHRASLSTAAAAAVAKRRSAFFESRHSSSLSLASSSSSSFCNTTSGSSNLSCLGTSLASSNGSSGSFLSNSLLRRQSAFASSSSPIATSGALSGDPNNSASASSALVTSQRAINAYLKMLNYLVPFVFADAVHSCAWLTKSKLHLPDSSEPSGEQQASSCSSSSTSSSSLAAAFNSTNANAGANVTKASSMAAAAAAANDFRETPFKFNNKLLEPTLIVDESAMVAFYDQLEQEHMADSIQWILNKFLIKLLNVLAYFSHKKFYLTAAGNSNEIVHEYLSTIIATIRQLCLLFGKHLTRAKLRPLIKQYVVNNNCPSLYFIYIAALTSFEPIEQQEFEEIITIIRQNLLVPELTRNDVEILAIAIKIMATSSEQIRSPSTRQKFLTYTLDALASYSNQTIRVTSSGSSANLNGSGPSKNPVAALNSLASSAALGKKVSRKSESSTNNQSQTQAKEFMLIMFRHILTCLIDPKVRPAEWAHILVTKFLPLLILLANDSADVYVCTYARLMCAQLVDTFDNHLSCPKLTQKMASQIMPALNSLKGLTEQIRASNLKRQIEALTVDLNERFFRQPSAEASPESVATNG